MNELIQFLALRPDFHLRYREDTREFVLMNDRVFSAIGGNSTTLYQMDVDRHFRDSLFTDLTLKAKDVLRDYEEALTLSPAAIARRWLL